MAYSLTIVVPTFNEAGNVEPLVERLDAALRGTTWEVVFVDDDSTDDTADRVRRLSEQRNNVRLILRVGRRGLATAAVEGMMSSTAPMLAVMDGDLQHDPAVLPGMLAKFDQDDLDIVIASRFADGSQRDGLSASRTMLSRVANSIGRRVAGARLSDPMTGFFMLRRSVLDEVVRDLTGTGFKILLDIFASAKRPLRFAEVPMTFHERHSGESKLNAGVMLAFGAQVFDKFAGSFVPTGLLAVLLMTGGGVALHVLLLAAMIGPLGAPFATAQAIAASLVIAAGVVVAARIGYLPKPRRPASFAVTLAIFGLAAALGVAANLWLATTVARAGDDWMRAGAGGALLSIVWACLVAQTVLRSRRSGCA